MGVGSLVGVSEEFGVEEERSEYGKRIGGWSGEVLEGMSRVEGAQAGDSWMPIAGQNCVRCRVLFARLCTTSRVYDLCSM